MSDDNRINLSMNMVYKDFKEGTKYPWLKGYVSVDGKVYEAALWPVKSGKPNSYSGVLKLKEDKEEVEGTSPPNTVDDSLPF